MARSPQSRLFDNRGRRIRHLNADLKKNPSDFRKAGLERQKGELEKFRNELREEAAKNGNGKLTNEQLYEAEDRMKTDDNLTTNKKKIDQVTRKMISEEPEDFFDQFDDVDLDDLFGDYATISGKYIGQSGDPEYRAKAQDIIESAILYQMNNTLTEGQEQLLNQMVRQITDSLGSKGRQGVLFPVGARNKK